MEAVEVYCREALEMGVDGAKMVDPRSVVTAEWVRMKCQFGCHRFGTGLCCPPHTPTPDLTRKVVDSYQRSILIYRRLAKDEKTKNFNEIIVRLEMKIFLDGYYKAWSMGSGPCRLCKVCDSNAPCKHAQEARPSMEACGIDVYNTLANVGYELRVVKSLKEGCKFCSLILID